jgi:hypothetical protein
MTTSLFILVPAAQYVRMSTEHQQYSIDNQKAAIQEYAKEHGFTIVQTYADAGKSGIIKQAPGGSDPTNSGRGGWQSQLQSRSSVLT